MICRLAAEALCTQMVPCQELLEELSPISIAFSF